MAKHSSRSKEHRDSAAKLLKQSRRPDYASIRGSLSKTAAAHKVLAHDEEIARGEPQRSRKRAPKKSGPKASLAMNEHEILQSFRHNGDGTWTPLKTVAVGGVRMKPGLLFSRGVPFGGIDVAAYLDDLAQRYPLSVRD